MRKPTIFSARPRQTKGTTSLMAVNGQNLRDLPQLLDSNQAQLIVNLDIDAQGQLIKRKGLLKIMDVNGVPVFFEHWYNDIYIITYTDDTSGNHSLSVLDLVAKTESVIKSDFSEFPPFTGDGYGNYFFIGSGGTEKIGRLSITLNYNNEVASFTAGEILTGASSGATATILEVIDNGLTGILTLGDVDGIFQNGEQITDSATGDALVNGVVTHIYTEISSSPTAKIVRVLETGTSLDARLFSANFKEDTNAFQASDVDDGTNPPFDSWLTGTSPTSGFKIFNRKMGSINSISSLGSQVIVGGNSGRYGFRLQQLEIAGAASKNTVIDFNNKQEGMAIGTIETDTGVYFGVNGSKIARLLTGGQTNVPFSEQAENIGIKLGDDYFTNANFNNLSIIEDTRRKLVLFSFGNDSDVNNQVIAYNTDTKSVVTYQMNINSFTKVNEKIYGVSSVNGNIYEMFTGDTDNGKSIFVDYQQEIKISTLEGLSDLENFWIQGVISEDSIYRIEFNIFDRNGIQTDAVRVLEFTGLTPSSQLQSWGSAGFGMSAWGSGSGGEARLARIYQADIKIPEMWRLSVRITNNDKLPSKINFFSALFTDRQENLILNNMQILN